MNILNIYKFKKIFVKELFDVIVMMFKRENIYVKFCKIIQLNNILFYIL